MTGNLLAASAVEPAAATLTIALQFDRSVSPVSLASMENEVQDILLPAAHVQWRMLSRIKQGESFERVIISRFTGWCDADAGAPRTTGAVLGHTDQGAGNLLPFPEIDCDAVRSILASQVHPVMAGETEAALGIALGRVLAHEVFHVIVNTAEHSQRGVFKAEFSGADLFSKPLRLDRADLQRLSAALASAHSDRVQQKAVS